MASVSTADQTPLAFELAHRLGEVRKFLLRLFTNFQDRDGKIALLIEHLDNLSASILETTELIKNPSGATEVQTEKKLFDGILEGTKKYILFLESKLDGLRSDFQDEKTVMDRLLALLEEARRQDYVNTNIQALNLLSAVLQR